MTRLVFAPQAAQDLKRLTEFLISTDPATANDTIEVLIDGLRILKHHPLVGRTVEHDYRELVISRGRSGYVALYKYNAPSNTVLVLDIRHQCESGFSY